MTLQCFLLMLAETCNKTTFFQEFVEPRVQNMFFSRICWHYNVFLLMFAETCNRYYVFEDFLTYLLTLQYFFLMFAETCKRYCFFEDFWKKSFDTTMFFFIDGRNMQQNNVFSKNLLNLQCKTCFFQESVDTTMFFC